MKTNVFYQVVLDNSFQEVSPLVAEGNLYVKRNWHTRNAQWSSLGLTSSPVFSQTYTRKSDAHRGARRFLANLPKSRRAEVAKMIVIREMTMKATDFSFNR